MQIKKWQRPKLIVIEFKDKFTKKSVGKLTSPYDPVQMLNGWYRKYAIIYKKHMTNILRENGILFKDMSIHVTTFA